MKSIPPTTTTIPYENESDPGRAGTAAPTADCAGSSDHSTSRCPNTPKPAETSASSPVIAEIEAQMASIHVEQWPLERLQENVRNPRQHSEKQVAKIAASIRAFGFLSPMVVDEQGTVLAGHGRLQAARLLGLPTAPVVQVGHLSPEQKRAWVIADNRLAELAGWDTELLRLELEELSALDLDFEVEITGFDTVDMDRLTAEGQASSQRVDEADWLPSLSYTSAVARPGEVWSLGRHRLICGDALDPGVFHELLGEERAQLVFTDPPYNVPIAGHVTTTDRHREFAMASGEMSEAEFTTFLGSAFKTMATFSIDGAIHYVCMDWRHQPELLTAAKPIYGAPNGEASEQHVSPLSVAVVSRDCAGSFVVEHDPAITALGTMAVALFAIVLAIITARQIILARDEFRANRRPKFSSQF